MKTFFFGALVGLVAGVTLTLVAVDRTAVENIPAPAKVTQQSAADYSRKNAVNSVATNPSAKASLQNIAAVSPASNELSKSTATNLSIPPRASVRSPAQTANPAVVNPIQLTDAHRQLLDSNTHSDNGMTLAQRHDALQAEDLDVEWSYYMEDQLNRFFASHAPPLRVDIVNVACRTTGCEVQAFEDGEPAAMISLIKAAGNEQWWDFSGAQSSTDDYQGRERSLVFLQRKLANQTTPVQTKGLNSKIADRR